MSERDNVMRKPADGTQLCENGAQEEDVVSEIEVDELDMVAGGPDGSAVGHN